MATNELFIGEKSFNKKFKNTLKNYYTYGFKNIKTVSENENTKEQTVKENIERLKSVFGENNFSWEETEEKISLSTRENNLLSCNPFYQLYNYCNCISKNDTKTIKDIVRFFSVMLQLNDTLELTGKSTGELAKATKERIGNNCTFITYLRKLADMGLIEERLENVRPYWKMSPIILSSIIEQVKCNDFSERFFCALEFYSQYFIMGEIGQNILKQHKRSNFFKFRHEHIEQCLNDYNIVDLIECLENKKYCIIEYKHGVSAKKEQMLCLPLRIKTNILDGRQYLLYYEPSDESCLSLRMDFIENISYINLNFDIEAVKKAEKVAKEIWGISAGLEQKSNLKIDKDIQKNVILELCYDEDTYNRIINERRVGTVTEKCENGEKSIIYTVPTRDIKEMRPWIRSFYGKLKNVEGLDDIKHKSFSIQDDVDDFIDNVEDEKTILYKDSSSKWKNRSISSESFSYHEMLFNKVYNIIYQIIGDVLTQMVRLETVKEGEVEALIEEAYKKYECINQSMYLQNLIKIIIRKLQDEFAEEGYMQTEQGVDAKGYFTVNEVWHTGVSKDKNTKSYRLKKNSFEVPLNLLEIRWLMSILKDEKIELFLTKDEINSITSFIINNAPENIRKTIKPMPMDKFDYVGQQLHKMNEQEKRVIGSLLKALKTSKRVEVKYKGSNILTPLFIEYSKENDMFQGYFCDEASKIEVIPLNEVDNIHIKNVDGITEEMRYFYEKSLNIFLGNQKEISIEFYDTRNIPDRILMEFSPWQKKCVREKAKDDKKDRYRLTINYFEDEENELVRRLLGYGKYIRILPGDDNTVKERIIQCYKKQQELFRSNIKQNESFR